MSTRSTTHFIHGDRSAPDAIIYRHSDGYPEGHGVDLQRFFDDVERQATDTRFSDPSYLAAKLIVWLAAEFAPYQHYSEEPEDRERLAKESPLDFLSVGVVQKDPGDIEYRYLVDCSKIGKDGRPAVTCIEIGWGERGDKVVEIPGREAAVIDLSDHRAPSVGNSSDSIA